MQTRLRLVWIGLLVAVAATVAFGSEISVHGRQGHSTAAVVGAEGGEQATISYWQYKNQQAQSRQASDERRVSPWIFRSGSRSGYRPRMVDRGAFRYRSKEFRKRSFGNLRSLSQHRRFGGRRTRYSPASRYTTGFRALRRRNPSTIHYGFQRPRP